MDASSLSPFSLPAPSLGLIGLGLMGIAVSERLINAGATVIGWDLSPERNSELDAVGGTVATDLANVFSRCDRVLLSLPTHETVKEVLEAVSASLHAGHVLIDLSTGEPAAAVEQARELSSRGIEYLDATVSGSSQQLREGAAVFLVGATDYAYIACLDIFDLLTSKSYHTGPPGSGARMKLVTNLVLGLNRAALAEGLWYAASLGMNLDQTLFLLRESMAYSRIMDTKGEKMVHGDFEPQARLSQHLKDVRLILESAGKADAVLPLTEAHQQLLEVAVQMGLGEMDNSAIIRAFSEMGR